MTYMTYNYYACYKQNKLMKNYQNIIGFIYWKWVIFMMNTEQS